MICAPCKDQRHDECPTVDRFLPHPAPFIPHQAKTWCDCQHRTLVVQSGQAIIKQDAEVLARLKEDDE